MQYDNHLDDTIIRILNDNKITQKYAWSYTKTEKKKEELHFKGILKAVEEYYREVTHSMLSLHLTMLEKENIIERDKEFKNGHARFYRLTNNTKLALELELPIPKIRSTREENRRKKKNNNNAYKGSNKSYVKIREDRNKKAYLLLMSLATIGFSVPKPIKVPSDIRAGLLYTDGKLQRFTPKLPGICINDMVHPYRDSANAWRFEYLKFKDAKDVKWYLDKLMQFDPPIIRPINEIEWLKKEWLQRGLPWPVEQEQNDDYDDATKRYGIADKWLKELIHDCVALLSDTEMLMRYIWKYERKPKPEEIAWYEDIYGKQYTKSYFVDVNQKRNWLKKKAGTKADQTKKVQADAMVTYKNAVEVGNTESPECKTARMILDFIDGYKTINRFKSVPKKVYQRLLGAENEYYAMADDTISYSNVIAPIMKELSYPKFMDKVVS